MVITANALYKYFVKLLSKDTIVALIKATKRIVPFSPMFKVKTTCGMNYGGLAYKYNSLEISSWVLQDAKEAKGVVRHEVAHLLHDYIDTGGTAHGKEYIGVLKTVSPNTWRRDRHFRITPAIHQARKLIHPSKHKVNVASYRIPYTHSYAVV